MAFSVPTRPVAAAGTSASWGQAVNDDLSYLAAAWTSYSPTWTAGVTNPTNGSITAAYQQVGKTFRFWIRVVAGASTTFGSGIYEFSLPGTLSSGMNHANMPVGEFYAVAGGVEVAGAALQKTSTTVALVYMGTGLTAIGSGSPGTWAATSANFIQIHGEFEGA